MPAWTRPAVVSLGLAAGISACLSFDPFACTDSAQCVLGGSQGVCEQSWCAYPDPECDSNLRYDDNAGGGLAGICVGDEPTTESDPTVASTDTMSGSGTESTSGSTTASTTMGPSSDSMTTAGTDSGDECGGAGQNCCPEQMCNDGLTCLGGACGCVVELVTGVRHNCVRKVDGTVWCWGDNASGQLGTSTNAFETTPMQVGDLGPGMAARALSANQSTCALREDDVAICWGDNASGQVDPLDLVNLVLAPVENASGSSVTLIANGRSHTCFGRSDGTNVATCFGDNSVAQLTGVNPGPGPVDIPAGFQFVQLEAGFNHTCGRLANGQIYCWGSNAQGQLGADPAMVPTSEVLRQVPLAPAGDMAVGRNHTCARVGNDVHCWGQNTSGELGDGTGVPNFNPSTQAQIPNGTTVIELIAAPDHTCIINSDAQLICWGSNANGQLRLPPDSKGGDQLVTLTPVEIDVEGAVVADASGGTTHSCILTERGRVLCWGTNNVGQIGDGSTAFAFDPTEVQVACP